MNWQTLSALHELYERGETGKRRSLVEDVIIRFLLFQTHELKEGVKTLMAADGFAAYYEIAHLANYLAYRQFLTDTGLLKPQLRFRESDIRVLMDLKTGMESGELVPIRDEIIKAEETVRGVSQMFFRHEKYLEKSVSLIAAVKSILCIPELANDKDQQYKYVLESHKPLKI